MGDSESSSAEREAPSESDPESSARDRQADSDGDSTEAVSTEELRKQVEQKYDFADFGPADMSRMSAEEWEAAFDPETWITGTRLLDRVEADLTQRIADRDVFARLERDPNRLVVYSDRSHAIVYPDGSIEGEGTILRDVKPSVALCSMDSYEVPNPPVDAGLPAPEDVSESGGRLGDFVLQVITVVQLLAGLILLGGAFFMGQAQWIAAAAGIGFLFIGGLLGFILVNARLSGRYRAEAYRERLQAIEARDITAELDREEQQELDSDGQPELDRTS